MNIILMGDFNSYFSERLYIWQYFNLNFIPFFIIKFCGVLQLLSNISISVSITVKTFN